jgi:hypothetical protein
LQAVQEGGRFDEATGEPEAWLTPLAHLGVHEWCRRPYIGALDVEETSPINEPTLSRRPARSAPDEDFGHDALTRSAAWQAVPAFPATCSDPEQP